MKTEKNTNKARMKMAGKLASGPYGGTMVLKVKAGNIKRVNGTAYGPIGIQTGNLTEKKPGITAILSDNSVTEQLLKREVLLPFFVIRCCPSL